MLSILGINRSEHLKESADYPLAAFSAIQTESNSKKVADNCGLSRPRRCVGLALVSSGCRIPALLLQVMPS